MAIKIIIANHPLKYTSHEHIFNNQALGKSAYIHNPPDTLSDEVSLTLLHTPPWSSLIGAFFTYLPLGFNSL